MYHMALCAYYNQYGVSRHTIVTTAYAIVIVSSGYRGPLTTTTAYAIVVIIDPLNILPPPYPIQDIVCILPLLHTLHTRHSVPTTPYCIHYIQGIVCLLLCVPLNLIPPPYIVGTVCLLLYVPIVVDIVGVEYIKYIV